MGLLCLFAMEERYGLYARPVSWVQLKGSACNGYSVPCQPTSSRTLADNVDYGLGLPWEVKAAQMGWDLLSVASQEDVWIPFFDF